MTYAELTAAVVTLADDPALSNAQAGIWINANYALLLREREWPFMVGNDSYTVTSGTAETTFASMGVTDFAKPLRVWIASSSTSDKTQLKAIRYEDRNTPGLDGCYYITPDNLSIGLVKTPTNSTNVVTIDYLKKTNNLDGSTYNEPVFLTDFHWILVFKALMNYQFQQRENSDEFRQQYEEILDKMVRFYFSTEAGSVPVLNRGVNIVRRLGTSSPFRLN